MDHTHLCWFSWLFVFFRLACVDACGSPLCAAVSLWDGYHLCHVVIAVRERFVCIRALSLVIYQTSYLALLLSDAVTLFLSLVGQSAVTHQMCECVCVCVRTHTLHQAVCFSCEQISTQSCSSLCVFFQLEQFWAFIKGWWLLVLCAQWACDIYSQRLLWS